MNSTFFTTNRVRGRLVNKSCFVGVMMLLLTIRPLAGVKVVPPAQGVYHGVFAFGPREDRVTTSTVRMFENLVGKPVAWAYFSNNWFTGIRFPLSAVRAISRTGAVPFIRMMARSSFDLPDTVYTLQKIIDGKFDLPLIRWAVAARRTGIPLMVEFGGEMNGNWFPWSGVYNGGDTTTGYGDPALPDGPERFRDAYRHIIDLFRNQGADNITWVFHANYSSTPEERWNSMAAYYPGDDYIDWIGESAYGAQMQGDSWDLLTDVLDESYPELAAVSPSKPLALLEFGVIDDGIPGHKAAWIREGLDSIRGGEYPRIRGISYWESEFIADNGTVSNMLLNSSPDVLQSYRSAIADPYFVSRAELNPPALIAAGSGGERKPRDFALYQNFPNPFNPVTTISFALPVQSVVTIRIYNALGQLVATPADNVVMDLGLRTIDFDGWGFPSAVYFYRLNASGIANPSQTFTQVKKMLLLK